MDYPAGAGHHVRGRTGHAESLVSRLRAEALDVEAFFTLADAQARLAVYRPFYNEQRPHSSLGYRLPAAAVRPAAVGLGKGLGVST